MAERPLSPHLSIWKWGPHMLVSILHRISGDGFALVGLPVLIWWIYAMAAGEMAYARFIAMMTSPLGMVVLIGLTWAFFNHLCSGLRHMVLDMGAGYELDANRRWSYVTMASGLVLTAAFWVAVIFF
ncbi:MAG: succinate dehydrogenase, cytochrome b556 subunit [Alteraurantiacibacter sp.]|nr:succinate dehydrogenase, cytochrome b556 subunit [Alteraurantiacibacter sp.]